jgi:proteasome beta subunit
MQGIRTVADEHLFKGTTTIGMVCKDGVVLATERRATAGSFIANKYAQKLFRIDSNLGMTIAGLVGDAQVLARYLKAEVSLYRLRRNAPLTVEGGATLLSNILSGNRMFPLRLADPGRRRSEGRARVLRGPCGRFDGG